MLAKRYRLHKRGSFAYLYRHGQRCLNASLSLYYIRSTGLRAGFSVSNKLGKACRRNKIKRRLRAAFRALMPRIRGGYQMVIVAREGIVALDYAGIERTLVEILKGAGILDESKKA